MTIFSGPFSNGNMNQAQWEEVESKLWPDGVIAGARNAFATTTTSGLGISVNTGDAILDGFRFYADAATALTAATADPSLPRIDLLVLRIDETAHTSTIALKTGTPASSPVAPTATKTVGGTYELPLYQVRVNAASSTITSLTDVRTYTQPTNTAPLSGATFTGPITAPTVNFGGGVSGSFSNVQWDSVNHVNTMWTPQSGVQNGIAFITWDGAAQKNPFAVGIAGASLSYVDTSGRFHDSAGLVAVEGANNSITPLKVSAGTALPGALGSREIFILLA